MQYQGTIESTYQNVYLVAVVKEHGALAAPHHDRVGIVRRERGPQELPPLLQRLLYLALARGARAPLPISTDPPPKLICQLCHTPRAQPRRGTQGGVLCAREFVREWNKHAAHGVGRRGRATEAVDDQRRRGGRRGG